MRTIVQQSISSFDLRVLAISLFVSSANACPDYLNQEVRKLRSKESINLCEDFAGKPILVINTASHCGFTPQFRGLEALHQEFKEQGLVVLGFPSNDFRQEASSEEKTAEVCYINYGVSFTMFAPVAVKGDQAHPLFKALAEQAQAPAWNFNKYLLDAQGRVVKHFGSAVTPDSSQLRDTIQEIL